MQSEAFNYIHTHTMDSFHIYLPSNACHHIYPNNTPSDYQTQLDQTIKLEGAWEVGVESICYSSHIDDKSKKAQIICEIEAGKNRLANDYESFKFKLNRQGKWKGLAGIVPTQFEEDPANIENVIKTLNAMNSQIFKENKTGFTFRKEAFSKDVALQNFVLKLSSRLTQVLGYKQNILTSNSNILAFQQPGKQKLTAEDYSLQYFSPDVQKEVKIELLTQGQLFDGEESTLLKLWSEKVKHFKDVVIRFSNHKLIIDNYSSDYVVRFSPNFAKIIGHELPIIGRGTTWGKRQVKFVKGQLAESWYVEIFSTELKVLAREMTESRLTLDIYPWQYDTMEKVMENINREVTNAVQRKMKELYNAQQHEFKLSLNENGHCKLALGPWLKIRFTQNLSYLFGLKETLLQHPEVKGMRHTGSLRNRERELFLLSNIANTTAYGKHHLQILQNFLHKSKGQTLIEKHFDPIMYVPLLNKSIDRIQLQLTTDDYQPINISGSKTLVCLIFRKVSENAMI